MNKLFDEFLSRIPSWGRILILLGGMFLTGVSVHSKVMSDIDKKIDGKLLTSPAFIATVELKTQIGGLQKLEDERDQKIEIRLNSIDGDLKQVLRGQQGIFIEARSIRSHAQILKTVANNIKYETRNIKQDTNFLKENAVLKKKK